MTVDIWREDEKAVFADCFFYPEDCVYRGNLYNADGRPIGDYSSKDSAEIEKRFPGIFGE